MAKLMHYCVMLTALFCISTVVNGVEYELAPNPNPGSNTITILGGDVALNNAEPFTNWGGIVVQDGATLRNITEMDIVFDEDGWSGGLSFISIRVGGILETLAKSKMNFDTVADFYVSGTVNNYGDISSGWSMQLAVGSQFNNYGFLNNKRGGTLRGEFNNVGVLANSTSASSSGGFFQQIGHLTNQATGSVTNQGEFLNFTTITNHGSILNTVIGGGGIQRGIFRNMGTLDNEATGTVTNRHRWFNTGKLNNAGLITNHIAGLGMSNAGAEINNLAGGTFQNDRVINSTGLITNAGTFLINGPFTTGYGVRGSGTYTQTAGETVVNSVLAASVIDFMGGTVSGNGILEGPVNISDGATLSPGQSAGHLEFVGDLNLAGDFSVELESDSLFDSIAVSSVLNLGSTSSLTVSLPNGFTPSLFQTFDLIEAEQLQGQFNEIRLPAEWITQFRVVYLTDQFGTTDIVRLIYQASAVLGDMTGDDVVTGFDVAPFVNELLTDGPYNPIADINGDGTVDGFDVDPFVAILLTNNNAIPVQNVPEPGTMTLLGIGLMGLWHKQNIQK